MNISDIFKVPYYSFNCESQHYNSKLLLLKGHTILESLVNSVFVDDFLLWERGCHMILLIIKINEYIILFITIKIRRKLFVNILILLL